VSNSRQTTNYNRRHRVLARICDLFVRLECFGQTHDWYLRERQEILDSPDYQKLTIADKEYCRGYQDCWWDLAWQTKLIWGCLLPDGKWYPTTSPEVKLASEQDDHFLQKMADSNMCAHIWIKSHKPHYPRHKGGGFQTNLTATN